MAMGSPTMETDEDDHPNALQLQKAEKKARFSSICYIFDIRFEFHNMK